VASVKPAAAAREHVSRAPSAGGGDGCRCGEAARFREAEQPAPLDDDERAGLLRFSEVSALKRNCPRRSTTTSAPGCCGSVNCAEASLPASLDDDERAGLLRFSEGSARKRNCPRRSTTTSAPGCCGSV